MDMAQIQNTMIFRGMTEEEISSALSCLQAEEKHYEKGQVLLHAGSVTEKMGLVLEGSVTVESNDVWGNRTILSHIGRGQFFAETYAILQEEPLLVDVTANEDSRVLFLKTGSLSPEEDIVSDVESILCISCRMIFRNI